MEEKEKMKRCDWCLGSELMMRYHDTEWGVPLHNDRKLFEFMVLDAFQAGLSWSTILNKRKNFEKAFDNFNAVKIAKYSDKKIKVLLQDAGIIRNRLKILATVENAKQFLRIQKESRSFDQFIWQFVKHKPIQNKWKVIKQVPAKTIESDAMSKALKEEGFKFVGSTICYAFMQAAGMVNDHLVGCFRYKEVKK
ncbi:MAG: DNA-3-methyladenine glycosylase I [Nanoarchaeota archaeon]